MTRQELFKVRSLKYEITEQEQYIANLRLSAEKLVPARDGLPHSSEIKRRVEKLALKLVEEDSKLAELRSQMELAKHDLTAKILAEVTSTSIQRLVLLRYVDCLPYKEVARRMKRSLRWTFKLHEKFFQECIRRSY